MPSPSFAPQAIVRPSAVSPVVPAWASHVPGTHLTAVRIPGAVDRSATALAAAVTAAYADLFAAGRRHPVRFWNFLPGINDPLGDGQTRYMAFNAGRLAAFADRPTARDATASAVGHAGRDLWVHCLSADHPAAPVDNPRQVPPHRYSARYGRRPPCFSRACWVAPDDGRRLLLVGGTASVVGEDSVHDDLPGQVRETLANLSAVAGAAEFTAVRVYHVPAVDPAHVRPLLPDGWPLEWVPATLCRSELLVEIEGLARDPA